MRRETPLFTVTGRLLPFPVPSGHISSRLVILPLLPSLTPFATRALHAPPTSHKKSEETE